MIRITTFLGELKGSGERVETEDTTPPFPPKLKPLPGATNQSQITLQGLAEPGATVKIFLDGEEKKEVLAETDGSFTAEALKLSLGKNKIKAKAIDGAGNESRNSGVMIIEYDTTPPELTIEAPQSDTSFSGEEREAAISGQTEPRASLTINEHFIILDHEGYFSYTLTLSEGENTIFIEAEDLAGNKTEKEIVLIYSP